MASDIKIDKILFRKRNESDVVFEQKAEPVGDYVLELNNEVVATGGFFLHYNMPFADLYMEVKEDCRKKGLGSFLIQELKTMLSHWQSSGSSYRQGKCCFKSNADKSWFKNSGIYIVGRT